MDFVDRLPSSSTNGLGPDDSLEYLSCDEFNNSVEDIDAEGFNEHRSSIGGSIGRIRRHEDEVLNAFHQYQERRRNSERRNSERRDMQENVEASIANISNIVLRNKRIRFAEGTAPPSTESIASTIYEHEYVTTSSCVVYKIQFWLSGRLWTVIKRYSEFRNFYKNLKHEKIISVYDIPKPPKKRWFEGQRWFDRFNDKYTLARRLGLQFFLREIFRIPDIEKSNVVRSFIEYDNMMSSAVSIYDIYATRCLSDEDTKIQKSNVSNISIDEINEQLSLLNSIS